jgi:hypothetical protein
MIIFNKCPVFEFGDAIIKYKYLDKFDAQSNHGHTTCLKRPAQFEYEPWKPWTSSEKNNEMSKIFTVFGATGQQGGALINFILQHETFSKEFRLRGVTRHASKAQAVKLKERGVQLIEVRNQDENFRI